jgi:sugar lactone lactonase YvrE
MTAHRGILAFALMVPACSDELGASATSADTLMRCHPFAGTASEPARSQRSSMAPTDVVAWQPPPAQAYEGALAPNTDLSRAERFGDALLHGPEDVAFDEQGRLYTGTEDGIVWRASVDAEGRPESFSPFAALDSRPLGLAFDECGNLIVAAGSGGIVGVSPEGLVRTLADRVDGTLIEFADELAVARDGTVYVTDATTKYSSAWPYDFLEGRPYGRVIAYEPATGDTRVVLGQLYFANGVVVAEDESWLLVAESLRLRVQRLWLSGNNAGTSQIFAENLPVIPDNIALDEGGQLWVTGGRRTEALEQLSGSETARLSLLQNFSFEELVALLPLEPYGLVLALGVDGVVVRSLHDPSGQVVGLSTAVPHGGSLYLGKLTGSGIARASLAGEL